MFAARAPGLRSHRPGQLVTPATWMRSFVQQHPKYQHDSVVSDEVAYDLLTACADIAAGKLHVPELHGAFRVKPADA